MVPTAFRLGMDRPVGFARRGRCRRAGACTSLFISDTRRPPANPLATARPLQTARADRVISAGTDTGVGQDGPVMTPRAPFGIPGGRSNSNREDAKARRQTRRRGERELRWGFLSLSVFPSRPSSRLRVFAVVGPPARPRRGLRAARFSCNLLRRSAGRSRQDVAGGHARRHNDFMPPRRARVSLLEPS